MSGECDKCGEHTVGCECESICRSQQNSLIDEDSLIRDFIISSAVNLTPQQIKEAEEESLWFEFTDDGLKMSKGLREFIIEHWKSITGQSSPVTDSGESL